MLPTVDLRMNRVIAITGLGTTKGFSVLMTDCIPDVQLIMNGQTFPQYLYQETSK